MASPISYFTTSFPTTKQSRSLRTKKYASRKRSHSLLEEEDGIDDQDSSDESAATGSYYTGRSSTGVVLTPDEHRQYLVAGLPLDAEIPGGEFPHKPPGESSANRVTRIKLAKQLTEQSQPVYDPITPNRPNLRLQHATVMTTIMHKCILEGDFIRAGRAWGLILRDSIVGKNIDVRNAGRWGIGAEILLWDNADFSEERSQLHGKQQWFTRRGFMRAKEYYERLVVHFPFLKHNPSRTSALDFYPAMFGLWISIVQEEGSSARPLETDHADSDEENSMSDVSMGSDIDASPSLVRIQRQNKSLIEIRTSQLAEATKIADEMDALIASPPYSDDPHLLRLRGMVALWVGDLRVSSLTGDAQLYNIGKECEDDLDYRSALEKKEREVKKADSFFQKEKKRRPKSRGF